MNKRLILTGVIFTISFVVLMVFCILIHQNGGDPLPMDIWARDLAYSTRGEKGGFGYWFWRLLTETGDKYFLVALGIALLFYTRLDYRFLIFVLGVVLEALLNGAFKGVYQRPRPDFEMWWMYESSTSFPSGHSTSTGFVYPYLIFIFVLTEKDKRIKLPVIILSGLFMFIVPVSRIVLGMHYLSDCIAGLSLGLITSALFMALTLLFQEYNILPKGVIPLFKKKKEIEDNNQ